MKFGELEKLKKKIGTDQTLANALWATGNSDARHLAAMIADPAAMSAEELLEWVGDIHYYCLADVFTSNVAFRSPLNRQLMLEWIKSPEEYIAQSGWEILVRVAQNDKTEAEGFFEPWLDRIEREIHSSPNRVRYVMNNAVIAIGVRSPALHRKAVAVAKRIGPVHVDHGNTGCKTPDAIPYMEKVLERQKSKQTKPQAGRATKR